MCISKGLTEASRQTATIAIVIRLPISEASLFNRASSSIEARLRQAIVNLPRPKVQDRLAAFGGLLGCSVSAASYCLRHGDIGVARLKVKSVLDRRVSDIAVAGRYIRYTDR